MAEASKTVEMQVAPKTLWDVITDYESYSEFVDTVKSVEVLSKEGGNVRVRYNIEMLGKDIHYTLDHIESAPSQMTWHLVESNLFKKNEGAWELEELPNGQVQATYRLNLEFNIYVPGMILSGLVKSSLPKMLGQFETQAKQKE